MKNDNLTKKNKQEFVKFKLSSGRVVSISIDNK